MDRPFWVTVLSVAIGVLIAMFFLWLFNKARLRKTVTKYGQPKIAYPTAHLVMSGLFAAFCVYYLSYDDPDANVIITVFVVAFSLASFINVVAHFYEEFVIEKDGLLYKSIYCGAGKMNWSSVDNVTFTIFTYLRFELDDGRRIRVSHYMTSLPELAKAVFAHVPLNRITPKGIKFLRQAERGVLPEP